ncbi:MAG: ATP-binding cassette domain-containing protein [Alphaproteobacteria bacterium]|nr:ATP-binding cassette domain-containing protein [Alphaproteobacteria bacterium]
MKNLKTPEILLKVEELCFSYCRNVRQPLNVVREISFDIHKGEFLCFLGPSGCGKTTLLRLIAGLEKPDRGSILPVHETPKIGMVFQDLALFPHMSAARNIGYALRHLSRPERRKRTDEMLDLVSLSDKRGAYPHELSGGQKQRLALARALARQPDLILLDEPFASQDITLRAQIRDEVMHILREAGVAALLVTHDPEEAMQFADRIAIMNKDGIQQIGTPSEVYNYPKNAFIASFFGQVNTLKGRVHQGCIATPLGKIQASEFQDNTDVQVIIRPEALKLTAHDPAVDHNDPNHAHAHAYVSERKYLGRSTLVHMDTHNLDDKNQKPVHIHARVPGIFFDQGNDIQDIFLDQSQIFVFKDEAA